jgi:hypothetical protein
MQLSKRFLQIIGNHFVATPRRIQALSGIDPRRIYVENIRAVLGSSSWVAKLICETAVRQGVFVKKIQILCPDGAVATTIPVGDPVPPTVKCWRDVEGEAETYTESTDRLDKIEFYEFVRGVA